MSFSDRLGSRAEQTFEAAVRANPRNLEPLPAWVPCSEAARLVNRSRSYIERSARDGLIRTTVKDGRALYYADDLGPLVSKPDHALSLGEAYRSLAVDYLHKRIGAPVPSEAQAVVRDWNAVGGPDGGYLIGMGLVDQFLDHVRSWEPLSRIQWITTSLREFQLATVQETTRAPGSRWGGAITRVNPSYGADLSVGGSSWSQPSIGAVNFVADRFITFGPQISEDLLADSNLVQRMVVQVQTSELAQTLIDTLVGNPETATNSLIAGGATITVAKEVSQTAGTIVYQNVDKMWSRLYGPCRRNAIFMCNSDTLLAIDQLATTEGWVSTQYMPQGAYGNDFPLLKGRPLIDTESCPAIGAPGDLILFDPTQVLIALINHDQQPGPLESPLLLGVRPVADMLRSLPVQFLESHHQFFNLDLAVFMCKLRACIRMLWSTAVTPANSGSGNTVSPYVILGPR
jgi:HK97 family phage major capsid protein